VLIFDGTSFPKQGTHSVGVGRQYCGALGKIANCQVATTVALWTGTQAWLLGAQLYLPKEWLTSTARARGRIPATVRFQEKWRYALTLLRHVRAAGFRVTAVLGDAEFGDNSTLRTTVYRAGLPYAFGVSSTLSVFVGTPRLHPPVASLGRKGRPHTRPTLPAGIAPQSVAAEVRRGLRGAGKQSRGRTRRPAAPGGRASRPSASHRRTRGASTGSRPKSGCWRSATLGRRRARSTTWCICRPRRP